MRFHSRPRSRSEYTRPTHSRNEAGFDPDNVSSLLQISKQVEALLNNPDPAAAWIREPEIKPTHLMALAGTFNPATTAHTGLIEVAKKQGASPAAFVVAIQSIDKEKLEVMCIEDRLALLDVIAARIGASVAIVNRGLYVDQAIALRKLAPERRVVFVTGFDKIEQVFDPKYYDDPEKAWSDLFQIAGFAVAQRGVGGFSVLQSLMRRPDIRQFGRHITPFRTGQVVDKDMSSSSIRDGAGAKPATRSLPPESLAFVRYWQPFVGDGRYDLRLRLLNAFKIHPELAENATGLRGIVSRVETEPEIAASLFDPSTEKEALAKLVGAAAAD